MTKPVFEMDDLPSEPVARPDAEKLADTMAWGKELRRIIAEFKDGDEGPLNEDEIRDLVEIIQVKIELLEGLITEEEYDERLNV
jgi:hypothetical protein